MTSIAIAMFIGLFLFGHDLFGWSDPGGQVKLGLFLAYVLGAVFGYKTRY